MRGHPIVGVIGVVLLEVSVVIAVVGALDVWDAVR